MPSFSKTQSKGSNVSLRCLFRRYRPAILFTWVLVVAEAVLFLLYPLLMGLSIDDLLKGEHRGLIVLSGLTLLSLLVGAGRRFYDTRIYSQIYATISPERVEKEKQRNTSVSKITARANLMTEFVEFLENAFPEIIGSVIALAGTLILIFVLNTQIFIGCLAVTLLIGLLYALTSKKTWLLNSGFNNELERQVAVIAGDDRKLIALHFQKVARWNIRLSDLETVNFSISWLLLAGMLVFAIPVAIQSGTSAHGAILTMMMYVFNYIESVIALPLFYQQMIRLREISHRLEQDDDETDGR